MKKPTTDTDLPEMVLLNHNDILKGKLMEL